jgi:NTP pyrophosphatase (non-canonical NTP hydrolase)
MTAPTPEPIPEPLPEPLPAPEGPRGSSDALVELRDALRHFATERDWDRFHAPKSLAAALIVEAGELLEPFQWLTEAQSDALPPETLAEVRLELADVLLYLVRLADRLGVDLAEAAREKMALNALRYPVEKARGRSDKYDRL